MANKKISELDVRASLTLADLLVVGDPTTGYAYKITVNDLKTVTGAGVISFNGRVGAVVPAEGDYSLGQLSNVIETSVVADQLLKYNGSNWVNWTPNYLTAESDTLDSVTDRGNTTTNGITVGTMDVTGVLTGGDTIKSTNGTVTTSMSYGASAGIIGTTSNHSLEIRTNNVYRIGVNTSGVVNVSNLAGTGSRMVVTDAAGNLSSQAIPSGTVTSVGLSTGTTGTDVNVTGSPVTSSGSITLNIPDASATARGLITTGVQTIAGAKTFSGIAYFNNVVYLPNNTFDGSAAAFGGNNTATYLFGSYTYAYYKNIFNTAWSAGVLSNNPTAYLTTNLFLQRAITAPSTGSYGLVATVVIKGTPITANTGSVTTAAALVVDGTTTGATNNYSIWAAGGNIRFDSLAGTGSRMVVASATGVLSAVANPVTGTGTINYIPKFTATGSTIGDSAIYSDGSSVRINTTAVHNNFTGELIVASSGNANLEVRAATSDQASIQLTQGTSDSSTSPRVEIFNSGNFGIVVYKPGVFSSNYVLYYDTESVTNRSLSFQTEGSDRLTLNQSGTVRMNNYTTNGFVKFSGGDGTLSVDTVSYLPLTGGTITGSNNQVLTINSTDPNLSQIWYNLSGTNRGRVYLYYNGSTTYDMVIGTYVAGGRFRVETGNNTTALTIDGDQNAVFVGGLTAVGATFSGAAIFTSTGTGSQGTINLQNDDPFIRFFDNGSGSSTDKKKWDLRAIGASGSEYFELRTINDANTVFSTKYLISHSGNFGLGVTPNTWDGAETKTIELGTTGNSISGYIGSSVLYITTNAYLNSGWRYSRSSVASGLIDIGGGGFVFKRAAAGTAGNAITWSDTLVLSSAGVATFKGNVEVESTYPRIKLIDTNNNSDYSIINADGDFAIYDDTNSAQRLYITSGGRILGGGLTSTSAYLDGQISVSVPSGTPPAACFKNLEVGQFVASFWNSAGSGDNMFQKFVVNASPDVVGTIDYNRGSAVTRYNTTSDANLKNLIGDADKQKSIDILLSTKIREYTWKDDETNKVNIGVIAQELYETFKGAVSKGSNQELFGTDEYKTWGVDKTAFTFHLIAGWQKHQEEIEILKAEILSLKK